MSVGGRAPNNLANRVNGLMGRGGGKTAVGVFSLAAIAAAAWMMKDSYIGSRDRIQQREAELKEDNDLRYLQYGQGHWSGNPSMDGLAHKWFGLKQNGPWGIKEKWDAFKIRVSSLFSDVLVPNLIPLGIGIAGLYGAGIKVHKPFVAAARGASGLIGPRFFPQLGNFLKGLLRPVGGGLYKLVKLPFSSVPAFAISLGGLALGSFFLKRFSDSYGHDGQRNFFREEIYHRHFHDDSH